MQRCPIRRARSSRDGQLTRRPFFDYSIGSVTRPSWPVRRRALQVNAIGLDETENWTASNGELASKRPALLVAFETGHPAGCGISIPRDGEYRSPGGTSASARGLVQKRSHHETTHLLPTPVFTHRRRRRTFRSDAQRRRGASLTIRGHGQSIPRGGGGGGEWICPATGKLNLFAAFFYTRHGATALCCFQVFKSPLVLVAVSLLGVSIVFPRDRSFQRALIIQSVFDAEEDGQNKGGDARRRCFFNGSHRKSLPVSRRRPAGSASRLVALLDGHRQTMRARFAKGQQHSNKFSMRLIAVEVTGRRDKAALRYTRPHSCLCVCPANI